MLYIQLGHAHPNSKGASRRACPYLPVEAHRRQCSLRGVLAFLPSIVIAERATMSGVDGACH